MGLAWSRIPASTSLLDRLSSVTSPGEHPNVSSQTTCVGAAVHFVRGASVGEEDPAVWRGEKYKNKWEKESGWGGRGEVGRTSGVTRMEHAVRRGSHRGSEAV